MNKKRPNIVIFMPDEMRGDLVGAAHMQLPHVDQLRQDGITFEQNFVVNPVCGPSRCCTFTGQYPQNGAHRSLFQLLRPHEQNMFRLLKESGYYVHYIGRNDLFLPETEALSVTKSQGSPQEIMAVQIKNKIAALPKDEQQEVLDFLAENPDPLAVLKHPQYKGLVKNTMRSPWPQGHKHEKSFYYGELDREKAYETADHLYTRMALSFLENPPQEPFCLYVGLMFPHPPYEVEEPYFSMYNRDTIPAPVSADLSDKPRFMLLIHERYNLNQLSMDDFREIAATYYGMVSRVDAQLGLVVDKLKEKGLYDDAVVFFLSDHGDYAGDYGLAEKWPVAFQDCVMRVPLIVKMPGQEGAGQQLKMLTEQIDVFPTMLELAGVETAYTHFGKSLLPLISGERTAHRDAVFGAGGYNVREPQCFPEVPPGTIYSDKIQIAKEHPEVTARAAMIRTCDYKLIIRSQDIEELYDVRHDPQETKNLIHDPAYQDIQTELRFCLLDWYLETSDNPHWERRRAK